MGVEVCTVGLGLYWPPMSLMILFHLLFWAQHAVQKSSSHFEHLWPFALSPEEVQEVKLHSLHVWMHGLRTPREEIAFTEWPKIHSHSQIFKYGQSIFCLPHRPNFSDIFDLWLHWMSVVRGPLY